MGYLLIDHRGTQGPDGKTGTKVEKDTVACRHCRGVIRVLHIGAACQKAYESPYRCNRCAGPICKFCAELFDGVNVCRPALAQIDAALKSPFRRRGRLVAAIS